MKQQLPHIDDKRTDQKGIARKQTLREILTRSPTIEFLRNLRLNSQASTSPRYTEKVTPMRGADYFFNDCKKVVFTCLGSQDNMLTDPESISELQIPKK